MPITGVLLSQRDARRRKDRILKGTVPLASQSRSAAAVLMPAPSGIAFGFLVPDVILTIGLFSSMTSTLYIKREPKIAFRDQRDWLVCIARRCQDSASKRLSGRGPGTFNSDCCIWAIVSLRTTENHLLSPRSSDLLQIMKKTVCDLTLRSQDLTVPQAQPHPRDQESSCLRGSCRGWRGEVCGSVTVSMEMPAREGRAVANGENEGTRDFYFVWGHSRRSRKDCLSVWTLAEA